MTATSQRTFARAARSVRLRAADAVDRALGRSDRFTPPRRLNLVGDSDFRATGEEFLTHFQDLANLQSTDRVLDIGCGIGRMARVLVPILRPPGAYDGFDVMADAIAWCRERYRDTAARFSFVHADLHNATYNPAGRGGASDYRFPYPPASFDLAIATSVFTHLVPEAAERYLAEAARVLRPEGRLLATFFLLDPVRPPSPGAALRFDHPLGPAFVSDPAEPEAAVGYPPEWITERLLGAGLRPRAPVHHGSWRGQPGRSFQDIVVADRV